MSNIVITLGETAGMKAAREKHGNLSEQERQQISTLATIAAGIAGGLSGNSTEAAGAGAVAGKNAVKNNALSSLGDIFGSQGAKYFEGAGTLEEQLATDGSLTAQEKQAIRDHYRKGDLPEDVIKAILEKNPGSDTVMALLQAETTGDYALAVLSSLPAERALALLGKLGKLVIKETASPVKNALTEISQKQLDKKFKHAIDFGIETTKKNPATLKQYASAIESHMEDIATAEKGTYGFVKDSKVYFNSNTNNAVVLDKSGGFVTGFKLTPGTPQYENYIKNGVLR